MAGFPSSQKDRIAFFQRHIDYAAKMAKPAFDAADRLIDQFENEAATDREADAQSRHNEELVSRTRANLIFGWIDQSIANLLDRHPHFTVNPLSPESAEGAPVVSAVSNYWYKETGQLRQDERILLDAFLTPYGVKKLGWTTDLEQRVHEFVEEPGVYFGDDVESDLLSLIGGQATAVRQEQNHDMHIEIKSQFMAAPDADMDPEIQRIIDENIKAHRRMMDRAQPDTHTSIHWESPFGQRWPPDMFFMDPTAQDGLLDAKWIAFKSRKTVDDVRANPNYSNTNDLEPTVTQEDAPPKDPSLTDMENDFGLVDVYEVWARDFAVSRNRRRNVLFVFAEGHDKVLRFEEEWPYDSIEDYPCEVLSFQSSPKSWFTKPSLCMAGGDNIQALTNEALDAELNVTRKMKNMLIYDSELFENEDIEGMRTAPDMTAFGVKGLARSEGRAIQAIEFGRIPAERGQFINQLQSLFDRAAGTPQPVGKGHDTATESSIADRRTTAREQRRGNLLAEFQISCARKFWQLTTQFQPDRLFLIHPAAMEWSGVTPEISMGEYNFNIDISSQAQAQALERKQWADVLNLMAGLAPVFQQLYGPQSVPNLQAVARRLLVRGYNEQNPEEILPGLAQQADQETLDPAMQGMINQLTAGAGGEGGPGGGGPAGGNGEPAAQAAFRQTEGGQATGAAMPRQFREPAPNAARIAGAAQTP